MAYRATRYRRRLQMPDDQNSSYEVLKRTAEDRSVRRESIGKKLPKNLLYSRQLKKKKKRKMKTYRQTGR